MRTSHTIRLLTTALFLGVWTGPALADEPRPVPPEAGAPDSKAEQAPTAEVLFVKGRDALFQGRYDEAVALLGQAVAADEAKTSYRLHLARAYRYAGNNDEAAKQLEIILKAAPDHVEAGQALDYGLIDKVFDHRTVDAGKEKR